MFFPEPQGASGFCLKHYAPNFFIRFGEVPTALALLCASSHLLNLSHSKASGSQFLL